MSDETTTPAPETNETEETPKTTTEEEASKPEAEKEEESTATFEPVVRDRCPHVNSIGFHGGL